MKQKILNALFALMGTFFIFSIFYFLAPLSPAEQGEYKYVNTLQQDINPRKISILDWEKKDPSRNKWSKHVYQEIENNFISLDKAKDTTYFCPNYINLNKKEKINFWAQIIVGISFFESGYNSSARSIHSSEKIDPVTNISVVTEGLMQLGYLDALYHRCNFNWSKDSEYDENDPRKSILNPYNNLSCGIKILTQQVEKYGAIVVDNGAYWAVIKLNHRHSRIEQIKNSISETDICKL